MDDLQDVPAVQAIVRALNKEIVQKAEGYGFEFVLSMVKLRGFGGESEFWDHNLESFNLHGWPRRRDREDPALRLRRNAYAQPAFTARMAMTIDDISVAVRHQPRVGLEQVRI